MVDSHPEPDEVAETPERLGRAFQMRVDIAVALSLAPAWLRRGLGDRNSAKAQAARAEVVERIAAAIERRFRITWLGSDDTTADARALDHMAPLFGGPASGATGASDQEERLTQPDSMGEHKGNV